MNRFSTPSNPRRTPFSSLLAVLLSLLLSPACSPLPFQIADATPTYFIAPRGVQPTGIPTATRPLPATPTRTATPEPTATTTATPTPPCTDNLDFLEDKTYPDGTPVQPGQTIEKLWVVENNGTCNWDARYRLNFAGGDALGAAPDQALYPARAGTESTLRVVFTAPPEPGTYRTAWQAVGPDGIAFGDTVYMEIIVQVEVQLTLDVVEE